MSEYNFLHHRENNLPTPLIWEANANMPNTSRAIEKLKFNPSLAPPHADF